MECAVGAPVAMAVSMAITVAVRMRTTSSCSLTAAVVPDQESATCDLFCAIHDRREAYVDFQAAVCIPQNRYVNMVVGVV